jgi:hypothetical protein
LLPNFGVFGQAKRVAVYVKDMEAAGNGLHHAIEKQTSKLQV